jgi:hypothetical protein
MILSKIVHVLLILLLSFLSDGFLERTGIIQTGKPLLGSPKSFRRILLERRATIDQTATTTFAINSFGDGSAARRIVSDAIVDVTGANTARCENPLRSLIVKAHMSQQHKQTVALLFRPSKETRVASALITEVEARKRNSNVDATSGRHALFNGTEHIHQEKRQFGSFWMEGLQHMGTQPFVNDSNYKVTI